MAQPRNLAVAPTSCHKSMSSAGGSLGYSDKLLCQRRLTDRIVRIDPATGRVTGWIDLAGLLDPAYLDGRPVDVLNGIAYDEAGDRIFVTGKLWPKVFEIALVPKG